MNKVSRKVSCLLLVMIMITTCFVNPLNADAKKNGSAPTPAQYAAVFNATYYATKYPDLQAAFGNSESALFNHFLNSGMKEGRQGSEEFNVQAYRARYMDLQAAYGDNLVLYYQHYVNTGKAEGRNGRVNGTSAVAPTPATTPAATPAPATPVASTSEQEQVVALVNQDRAANGLGALTTTPELMAAAQARAQECTSYFSHTRPNGTSCFTIFNEYGVSRGYAGENIAWGQRSAAEVENSWMHSDGHRRNILSGNFKHIGVGLVDVGGRKYWVQMFTD